MLYNGKEVFTGETFDYASARPGDYVAQEVADYARDVLPPAYMTSACIQMGEPYSHRQDPDTGRWRATYATFQRVADGVWQYCGHCFRGETVERGQEAEW